ncbi:MAG: hypothetical protein R2726_14070 [Acidimicrobiales bacterium]
MLVLVLLAGCRVFSFPVAAPDATSLRSSAVTVTNTTPHAFFVRLQVDCAGYSQYGLTVRVDEPGVVRAALLCTQASGFPWNGTVVTIVNPDLPPEPFVLAPGGSIRLVAEVGGNDIPRVSGRDVVVDAFGEWCYDGCYDIVSFTP